MDDRSGGNSAVAEAVIDQQPQFTAAYEPDAVSDELVAKFNRDGYIVIEDAVSPETIERVRSAADRIVAEGREPGRWWGKPETAPRRVEYRGIFNLDDAFMDLLAPTAVFPLVVKIMGANLHMMSSQLVYQKPHQPPTGAVRGGWHRDVIGTSEDLGYDATPRLALRVGYYVSDISQPGSGATLFAPGSHLLKEPIPMAQGTDNPEDFVRPKVKPGDAVIWENRTFHAPERNTSADVRKAIMIQYGYRWLRPVDYLTHPPELLERCDPVTRQLLDSTDLNPDGSMTRMKGSKSLLEWAAEHDLA
ncbi:MAG: phytanoyl-CoA dioxygenase family protein [Solirubrobacterales bacterium]